MRVTLKAIHDELRRLGHDVQIQRRDGYFYFGACEASYWLDRTATATSQPVVFSFGSAWICFQPSPAFTGSTVIPSKYRSRTAARSSAKGGEQ